jgi:hypothetical protein
MDPGKVAAALTSALTLGGSLRIDATTAAGTSTGIFRTSASFANSIGRSLQIGMNGTAIFTQTGNTLTVGSGIDETLDIGVKDESTSSSVARVGTLNLTVPGVGAVTQFTATVDKVRIGVQLQTSEPTFQNNTAGTAVLATNNDITAATEITLSDNLNALGSTLTASAITFGSGINNVTTPKFTLGGRKGTATATLPSGGTLNLKGFAERTLNLSIGRSDLSATSVISTGTLNAASGTLTGSFDAIVIGQKTGTTQIGGATGTMTLGVGAGAGNSVVANSLTLGVHTTYNFAANIAATSLGTLSMAGGIFTVYNDVVLGMQADNGTARGVLTITGGTFNVGGKITKTDSDRSNGVITVNGATAVLNMRNPLVGDTTSGAITASQFIFRLGSVTNTASVTLDGRDVTNGLTFGPFTDALIVRDLSLAAPVLLTGTTVDKGGVHYEAALNGVGATLASVSLGAVGRTFNVENSTATSADLTVTGAISGGGLLTKSGAGTLLLNGLVSGPASVIAGALGGTGNVTGAVNVGTNGTLTPSGTSIGTLATGPLTFAANATLALDINFQLRTADKTNINGALSLDGGNTTVLSITDLQPIAQFTFFTLPFLDYSTTWNGGLFTVGGVVIHDFDALNPNASERFFVGPNRYTIDYNYQGHIVALISVPEPGSLALVAGGVALLGGMRRRRSRSESRP